MFLANEKYEKLIDSVFSQGDSRYFDNYNEQIMMDFLINSAIDIELKDISLLKSKISENSDDIKAPQNDLKLLAKYIFKEYGATLMGFEKRIPFGVVDVLGKKDEKTIYVECGPCRIDKGFNYLRQDNAELWILTSEFDPSYIGMENAKLYIIKRGTNWQNTIKKYDKFIKQQLKKVKSPLDSL
mgnify:FL=1